MSYTSGMYLCVFAELCRSGFQRKLVVDRFKPWLTDKAHMDQLS